MLNNATVDITFDEVERKTRFLKINHKYLTNPSLSTLFYHDFPLVGITFHKDVDHQHLAF